MASSEHKSMPPPPLPNTATAVEYKKDGTVSRMRSHKGNVPQLPQTKLCPFCPAKFTRTTHLNRHLRNHTNERLYRCEICSAQFTRSDLLSRHKRSCGESHPISRSRKRSCQACTSLKVKCDLRQPCSKCRARGRECTYTSEEGQKEGVASSSNNQQDPDSRFSGPLFRLDASAGFVPSTLGRGTNDALAATFPELSLIEEASQAFSQPLSEANLASFVAGAPRMHRGAMSLPTIDADSDITGSSFRLGPNHAFTTFGASEIAGHSRGLHGFSHEMFEPFFRDVFSIKEETPQQNEHNVAPLLHTPDTGTLVDGFSNPNYTLNFPNEIQSHNVNLDRTLMSDLMTNVYYDNTQLPLSMPEPLSASIPVSSSLAALQSPPAPNPHPMFPPNLISEPALYTQQDFDRLLPPPLPPDGPSDPSTEELQQYLCVFLTAFLPQIPLLHTPTLRLDFKPPILLSAMQACGALFYQTPVARAFVEKVLGTSRNSLICDYAKPSTDPKHQIHSIVTLILLQTIGLFHQDPQQRAASNIYHGMLVLMIRQHRLVERIATWEHKVFPTRDPVALEGTWRDWAMHECLKRVVFLAYCQDQAHRIYFSLPPSFTPEELATCLPCDDELWAAKTPLDWSRLLLEPSPFGSIEERIHGVPMHRAFAAVGLEGPNMTASVSASLEPPSDLGVVSTFGHFILLQYLLGELFRRCSGTNSPPASPNPGGEEQVNEHVYAMQLSLHLWLQMWRKTPGNTCEKAGHFMADPLPFYWLAQLLLLAFQEGLPPFAREIVPAAGLPETQALNEPSPFAPSVSASSPFSSPFTPSPFSGGSPSTGSSPVLLTTPPPAYRSPSGPPPTPRTARYAITGPGKPDGAQFRLVKRWLHFIRLFLRRSQGSPTILWDELMKIRLCGWQGDESSAEGKTRHDDASKSEADGDSVWCLEQDGLIGFFEDKLRI
ncbi:fungal-specific transcription factor domain-containing protein [Russula dissimulans]|nr:fungal-specific transcription factor domain-containing protein [Russula dissimulans]